MPEPLLVGNVPGNKVVAWGRTSLLVPGPGGLLRDTSGPLTNARMSTKRLLYICPGKRTKHQLGDAPELTKVVIRPPSEDLVRPAAGGTAGKQVTLGRGRLLDVQPVES